MVHFENLNFLRGVSKFFHLAFFAFVLSHYLQKLVLHNSPQGKSLYLEETLVKTNSNLLFLTGLTSLTIVLITIYKYYSKIEFFP